MIKSKQEIEIENRYEQKRQQELQKILNVDLSGMNFAEQFSEDAPKEEPKTKEIDKKKLN